jgi:hypothetical protein
MQRFQTKDPDALLNEVHAADLLCLSVRTLQSWRSRGFGPAYVRAGRAVRYRRSALTEWTEINTFRPGNPVETIAAVKSDASGQNQQSSPSRHGE